MHIWIIKKILKSSSTNKKSNKTYIVFSRIFLDKPRLYKINRFHHQHLKSLAWFFRALFYSRTKVILVYLGLSFEIHRSSKHWHRFRQVIGSRKCFCNHMWPQLSVRQNHVTQSFSSWLWLVGYLGYRISILSDCLNSIVIVWQEKVKTLQSKWHKPCHIKLYHGLDIMYDVLFDHF